MKQVVLPLILGVGSLAAALGVSLQPPRSGPVALLFPPWWSAPHAMRAAASAGSVVRFGAFPFIVVVAPDKGAFEQALRQAGAWFILNPQVLGGCSAI